MKTNIAIIFSILIGVINLFLIYGMNKVSDAQLNWAQHQTTLDEQIVNKIGGL